MNFTQFSDDGINKRFVAFNFKLCTIRQKYNLVKIIRVLLKKGDVHVQPCSNQRIIVRLQKNSPPQGSVVTPTVFNESQYYLGRVVDCRTLWYNSHIERSKAKVTMGTNFLQTCFECKWETLRSSALILCFSAEE